MNIFGNGNQSMAVFDHQVLGAYYSSGVSLGLRGHASKIQEEILNGTYANVDPAVIPPWTIPEVRLNDEMLQRIFASGPLIDLRDPRVTNTAGDKTFESLFGLYHGLSKLRELATYAEIGSNAASKGTLLQSRLEGHLAEVNSYVADLNLDTDATLLYGLKETSKTSSQSFPKDLADTTPHHIGAEISTVRDDPIAGLTGTETFDITVTTSTGTTVVNLDLSEVSGTLNVDNIADYINGELSTASVSSTIDVERFNENSYGFHLNLNTTETVKFGNPSDGSAGVYIAGGNNVGEYSSGFVRKLDDLGAAAPNDVFRSETDTTDADTARGVAVDSEGNVYSVGTTAGDLGGLANQAVNDVFLRKYDAAGELVWSRMLGATDDANGFSVAVDANDDVVIAGSVAGQLSATAYGGNYDSFVTKFDGDGVEAWTRQAAPYANDGALALTTDSSGNIFIAGHTQGAIDTSITHGGGSDGYVTKLDTDGTLVWNKQFGGTGADRATAIAVDNAGSVYVAGENDGQMVLRRYADSDASQTPDWEVDLGSQNADDTVTGLAIGSSGNVYVSGQTSNAAISGSIVNAHSGGADGFVSQVVDSGASAAVGWATYLGSTSTDAINGIAVKASVGADEIYLTGATQGALDGGADATVQDAFVAKLDNAGAEVWVNQDHGAVSQSGHAITYDADATSVITRLGLPTGDLPVSPPSDILSLTTLRPGQYFSIRVDGGNAEKVEIEDDDSLGFLAYKIKKILGTSGTTEITSGIDSKTFKIEALDEGVIELIAGPEGFDALAPLGLSAGTLYGDPANEEDEEAKASTIFELGFFDGMSVETSQAAAETGILIDNAMREIRSLYDFITIGPDDGSSNGPVSLKPADAEKIAQMQAVLASVTSLANSLVLTNQLRQQGEGGGSTTSMLNILA
ncbi:MAG: SBBP repeat-containing protein [Alphaproteobacteria bacterium]|nr:SBBP repeat-containing protein [Alphaproteobacteria bacterium]MDP6815014.1 SBBP repeat-containing protein [Alphaproteobacteria bacterium]